MVFLPPSDREDYPREGIPTDTSHHEIKPGFRPDGFLAPGNKVGLGAEEWPYSHDVAAKICSRLAEGKSLTSIIANDKTLPSLFVVYKWLAARPEFLMLYQQARLDQADTLADEILDIADNVSNDTIYDGEGNPRANNEWIARSRLRVDARKFLASKLKPKKWGDVVVHKGDKESPISVNISMGPPSVVIDAEQQPPMFSLNYTPDDAGN